VSRHDVFGTVKTEGGLLPSDALARIAARDGAFAGLTPEDYHLEAGEKLTEAITRVWNRLTPAWAAFQAAREKLAENDAATGLTREKWLLFLFQELGYGRMPAARGVTIEDRHFPISHFWHRSPIHLLGAGVDLDRPTPGAAGAARASPHSLVQEFLNRSDESLWGFLSNGRRLRILRDSTRLTRQAYIEFDLEAMMEGEVYADFVLLFLLCHESRVAAARPEDCHLERWIRVARDTEIRALETLRDGVEKAIKALGAGFLEHGANAALRDRLRRGALSTDDYYRQILRLVYRLLFLFAAEDRDLLLDPGAPRDARERYLRYYSTMRLRHLAERMRGTTHADLYAGLKVVMAKLAADGCPGLALPALGSFLWSEEALPDLAGAEISNHDLLAAVRALAFTEQDRVLRSVDYKNLGAEELGSVYESLLELHAKLDTEAGKFELDVAGGSERKETGSYYTPTSLIHCLLDSALVPVLDRAAKAADPEAAILGLRICDPACGSGHFLVAAAHRVAKRLAAIRTGDDEPSPEAVRAALRDVIGHCVYGVDLNPMAVELCKVSLWLEALTPGKPLSFLDHRIRCGNSLIGATPALLSGGIPDEAFEPIEGDDKKVASALKKGNRMQRKDEGQALLPVADKGADTGILAAQAVRLAAMDDGSIAALRAKEEEYRAFAASSELARARLLADAWVTAFVWRKVREAPPAVTYEVFRRMREKTSAVSAETRAEIARLAAEYRVFHWHLEFPDVFATPAKGAKADNERTGWSGGFDVVLGNPPWEQMQLDAREFFAARAPDIANAQHMAARDRAIARLAETEPALHAEFMAASRYNEGIQHFIHNAGRYPLTSYGRLNSAPLFAELARILVKPSGFVGFILPSGIATDSFNQFFFQDLVDSRALVNLFDFENREGLFPAVDSRQKFCLLTLAGTGDAGASSRAAEFVFFAHRVEDLADGERRFTLSAEDIALLNPNTRTCPVFRGKRDAEITKAIYRRVPVLVNVADHEHGNPWGFQGLLMFMMNTASKLFRTREQLESDGWRVEGNVFRKAGERHLPLYEAKMVHQFDHRWATYDGLDTRDVTAAEKRDPAAPVLPRYWVPEDEVEERLRDRWDRGWLLGWRDITNATNERTVIASVVARVGVGNNLPLMMLSGAITRDAGLLAASLSSFPLDYVARFKVGGTHLNFFIYEQLPVLPPAAYAAPAPWTAGKPLRDWLLPRVLELVYTAHDLAPFARDCGYDGPPFKWDEERRFHLRCELDAAFFHLYGIDRDDLSYIMDTFPIVKRNDEAAHGDYRTKRVILEYYDAMSGA